MWRIQAEVEEDKTVEAPWAGHGGMYLLLQRLMGGVGSYNQVFPLPLSSC